MNTNTSPINPQTIKEFTEHIESLSDEQIEASIEVMENHLHTGKWGKDRLTALTNEQSRRWRVRRGEGRDAK